MSASPPGYRLTASTGIHRGDRQYQQDQVDILVHHRVPGCLLGIVADGMGGKSGGRKAADQVLLTARQIFERYSPLSDDPDVARRAFDALRACRDRLAASAGASLPELSMGMSGDLEAAVAAGSTCLRVGSALLGDRPAAA